MGQSAAHKNSKLILKAQNLILIEQNVSPDNVFLFKTLHTTVQENFFATIATHCNNMPLQVKNTTIVYVFCLHSHTVTDLSGNTCSLHQVQKITSLGCNWLILIHVVYFLS